jgi:hypothetical protein
MIEYQPTTYKCSSLDHKMRETCKYILLLSFVDSVNFVEVVVVDGVADVGPPLQVGEGGKGTI